MKFVCEKCNKNFDRYEDCTKHEFSCFVQKEEHVYLKYIMIESEIDCNNIYIYEHPNAVHVNENNYILSPKSNRYSNIITESKFDTIRMSFDEHERYYIVTKNLDLIYENECVKKLLDYKVQILKDQLEEYQEMLKRIPTTYSLERTTI